MPEPRLPDFFTPNVDFIVATKQDEMNVAADLLPKGADVATIKAAIAATARSVKPDADKIAADAIVTLSKFFSEDPTHDVSLHLALDPLDADMKGCPHCHALVLLQRMRDGLKT